MNIIKQAVELADGFELSGNRCFKIHQPDQYVTHAVREDPPQWFLDALAAQLRLQVQSDPHIVFKISVVDSAAYVTMIIYGPNGDEEAQPLRFVGHETSEAMAFITAIVESKVLS